MKKTIIAASVMLVAATAFASSITVPFFVDWAGIGTRGFVGLKNNTGDSIELSIFYRDLLGQNRTPGPDGNEGATFVNQQNESFAPGEYNTDGTNTFTLGPNGAITWRPASKGGGEGVGVNVPAMMGHVIIEPGTPNTIADDSEAFNPWNGSIEIRWETVNGERDIQGRYAQDSGAQTNARSEYLLPPGVSVP